MINIFYILFGLSFNYKISFFGDLYIAQIIIIFLSIYSFLRWFGKNSLHDYEKITLFLVFLWLVNQIFSDMINKIDFIDYIRGNAKILVTFLSFYVFFKLNKLENFSLIKMLLWILLAKIFFSLLNVNDYQTFLFNFKMGMGSSFSILIIIMSCLYFYKEQSGLRGLALLGIVLMGFLSLALEARSLFLHNLLFAGFLILNNRFKIQNNFSLVLSVFLMGFVISTIYQFLIDNNFLPQGLVEKQEIQSGALGVLLGGRSEFISSYNAILDNPLFGHGSWAKNCEYFDERLDVLFRFGYRTNATTIDCLIPTHSVIFGSWVTAGFFGFVVWFYLLFRIIKETLAALKFKNNYYELALYLLVLCVWHIIFSPYGGTRMMMLPLYIAIIFSISSNYKNKI